MFTNFLFFSEKYSSFFWLITITKLERYLILIFFFFSIFSILSLRNSSLVPKTFQAFIEFLYEFLAITINQQAGRQSQKYFPFFLLLFFFILFSNIIGLIPFNFTVTSHIFQTFIMGLSIIIALTIIGFLKHKLNFLYLFFPPTGTPKILIPLLIVIEIISYISRAFSLSIRLFANMMSGHTLLNIISSFSVKLFSAKLITLDFSLGAILKLCCFIIAAFFPILMIGGIFFLEFGIAFLQAYVFLVLVSIYLDGSLKGGH
jgi:ATP synthase subunit 6